jgi:archaetidylinositol phosphate synthase
VTLDRFRSFADRLFEPVVDAAEAVGLTANGVSVIAFVLSVAAGVAFLFAGGEQGAGRPLLYLAGAALEHRPRLSGRSVQAFEPDGRPVCVR